MKFGGVRWNTSDHKKTGVQTQFVCKYCSRKYKMEWAKLNHEKLCKEHFTQKE